MVVVEDGDCWAVNKGASSGLREKMETGEGHDLRGGYQLEEDSLWGGGYKQSKEGILSLGERAD